MTEYGQKTGKGSKKYAECKKKKADFVDEETIMKYVEKVPKQESFTTMVEKEVVGTIVHDIMQFHVDNMELPLMVDFLMARSKVLCIIFSCIIFAWHFILVHHLRLTCWLRQNIYEVDEEGRTPLHCFAQYAREGPNTTAMLKAYLNKLIAAGADLNLHNAERMSALTLACQQQKASRL